MFRELYNVQNVNITCNLGPYPSFVPDTDVSQIPAYSNTHSSLFPTILVVH